MTVGLSDCSLQTELIPKFSPKRIKKPGRKKDPRVYLRKGIVANIQGIKNRDSSKPRVVNGKGHRLGFPVT